jgi:hypothetical protein
MTHYSHLLHKMEFNLRHQESLLTHISGFKHTTGEGQEEGVSEATDTMELSVVESPIILGPPSPLGAPMQVSCSQQSGQGCALKQASSSSTPESNQAQFFHWLGQN